MNQKHLLRFIKKTIREQPHTEVCLDSDTKEPMTLQQVSRMVSIFGLVVVVMVLLQLFYEA